MGDVYGFAGGTTTDFIKLDVTNGTLTISGALTGGTIDIGGADASSFHVDIDGNMWLGAALLANASFKVTAAGAVHGHIRANSRLDTCLLKSICIWHDLRCVNACHQNG